VTEVIPAGTVYVYVPGVAYKRRLAFSGTKIIYPLPPSVLEFAPPFEPSVEEAPLGTND
jgi:hypothetical protein